MTADADRPKKKPKSENGEAFGKGYIRPTRTQAETVPDKFYELIDYLRARRKLTWKQIGEELGLDESNAARRINGHSFDDDQRRLVLSYLFDESRIISDPAGAEIGAIRDNLYYALMDFYRINATSQDNARAASVGTYRLWRHSVEDAGEYVYGRLDIHENEETGALHVEMLQPCKPRELMRGSAERFTGYLFRVADMYAMLLRDVANNDLRIKIFPHYRIEKIGKDIDPHSVFEGSRSHIVHMSGFGMGIDGNNLFMSPVYLELVDDKRELERLNDGLDVVPESDAPRRIVSKLKRNPIMLE